MTSLPPPRAQAYQVPRTSAPIDLHLERNEGDVPPAWLFEALAAQGADLLRSYPDSTPLRLRLAELRGVPPERVLVTAGGDEAIDRFFRALVGPEQEVVVPHPTFEMIPTYTRLAGARMRPVPWPGGAFPTRAVLDAVRPETAAIVVISPNNPTGAVASPEDLLRLAAEAPHVRLLVDAAYAEFADHDLTATALTLPQAVVIRTLSKAWGLAGLRVGYALASPDLIATLQAAGGPYSVSAPSLFLARALLEAGTDGVSAFVARIRQERRDLSELLRSLGADPQPSQANFILARFANADGVWRGLAALGIAVRAFPGRDGLEDCLRITCPGRVPVFDRLCAALAAVMAPEALLFDMDGVLADVSASYRQAILATAEHFGVTVGVDDVAAAKAAGSANNDWELTRRLMLHRGVDIPLQQVTDRFEELYQGRPERPGLRRHERLLGSRSLYERLAVRRPLAVVTGRPRADAIRFLEDVGIADLFPVVVCLEDAPLKPDPAPVRLALERLGVRSAWMLGDTPDDLRAARAAGVVPVGMVSPGDDVSSLFGAGAAWVLSNAHELEALLP